MQMFNHIQELKYLCNLQPSSNTINICLNLPSRIDRKCARKPPRESVQTFPTQTKRHYVECLKRGPRLSKGLDGLGPQPRSKPSWPKSNRPKSWELRCTSETNFDETESKWMGLYHMIMYYLHKKTKMRRVRSIRIVSATVGGCCSAKPK